MIAKALMENPDQRYQTAGDVIRDLIRLQRNLDDKDESRRATRLRSRGRRSVRRG